MVAAEPYDDQSDGTAEDIGPEAVGVITYYLFAVHRNEQEDRNDRQKQAVGSLSYDDELNRLDAGQGNDRPDGED